MLVSSTMNLPLYSVRMRAALGGRHLAGAERLVAGAAVSKVTAELTQRAMLCSDGPADEIHCSIERIESARVRYACLPDVSTSQVDDWRQGRRLASQLLTRAGVCAEVASRALALLADGAGPGGAVMRGAVIMDAVNGERLEADPRRGVRVSRMDITAALRPRLVKSLAAAGLGHHRVLEALTLAGKVLLAPGLVAELCWSDDPAYSAGYVAAPQAGYQRIDILKPAGDRRGGRVFFVEREAAPLSALVDYLERQAILFDAAGAIAAPEKWRAGDA